MECPSNERTTLFPRADARCPRRSTGNFDARIYTKWSKGYGYSDSRRTKARRDYSGIVAGVKQETVLKRVTIHTDGGCEGNPGPGGWAAVLRFGERTRELSGGEPATTNNRMELQAAISALSALKERCAVTLFTDSEYVRQGISEWLPRWKVTQWRTRERKPVKNEDLWRKLDELASSHVVNWRWLKGHAGHAENERCDQLAAAEIQNIRRNYSREQLTALREAFVAARDPNRSQSSLL